MLATLAKCLVADAETCDDNVVVFGDSLSDNGNLFSVTLGTLPPPAAGYDNGRFTNGKVWIEYLADMMGLNQPKPHYDKSIVGTNYAHGGASSGDTENSAWKTSFGGIPFDIPAKGLLSQTGDFLSDTSSDCASETLFAIWIGVVDLLMLGETNVMNIVNNIETSIKSLINGGATKFIVMNLPQLAGSPAYVNPGSSLFLSEEIPTGLFDDITAFNKALADMLKTIDMSNDVTITHVDIGPLVNEVAGDPTRFGIDGDVSTPTLNEPAFHSAQTPFYQSAPNALWYDGVHPSTSFHKLVAHEVHRTLTLTSPKATKAPKSSKAPKGTKAPKELKATKAPKISGPSKAPKKGKSSKAPKVR